MVESIVDYLDTDGFVSGADSFENFCSVSLADFGL